MNNFHRNLEDPILLRKLNIYNHQYLESITRLNSTFIGIKEAGDFFTIQEYNNARYLIKSLNNGGFIYGSNNENLSIILNENDRFISSHLIHYNDHSFVDIIDIDVDPYSNMILINERFNIYLYDMERSLMESELVFKDNFVPIITKFNSFRHDIIASSSKEELVIFDNRLKYSVDRNGILYSAKDIKRKLGKQPFYKPSDVLWINENQLAISTRSSSFLQIYDLRYTKSTISLKHAHDINSKSIGISQLKMDPISNLIYGLDTRNNVKIYDSGMQCLNGFQIESSRSGIAKFDIFRSNGNSNLITFLNDSSRLYIKIHNLPRSRCSEINSEHMSSTLKILENSANFHNFSVNQNWISSIHTYNDVSMVKLLNISEK